MLLYYYPGQNQLAMWYYKMVKGDKQLWLWVMNFKGESINCLATHRTLSSRRVARHLEQTGWCDLLDDSGDE